MFIFHRQVFPDFLLLGGSLVAAAPRSRKTSETWGTRLTTDDYLPAFLSSFSTTPSLM